MINNLFTVTHSILCVLLARLVYAEAINLKGKYNSVRKTRQILLFITITIFLDNFLFLVSDINYFLFHIEKQVFLTNIQYLLLASDILQVFVLILFYLLVKSKYHEQEKEDHN